MHKLNRDTAAQRTKTLAVAAKALEVAPLLVLARYELPNRFTQELAWEVAPEAAQEVA